MEGICVCNIASNSLSFIDFNDYSTVSCPIILGECPSGPHGICLWSNIIITANSYSNSISFISIDNKKEIKNIYVGAHPNDVKVYNDKVYILCGESNSLVIFDLIEEKVIKEISLDIYPHFIDVSESGLAAVVNMQSNKISIIDCNSDMKTNDILVGEFPTKCKLLENEDSIIVCESNLGLNIKGNIVKYNMGTKKKEFEYQVGYGPVDFFCANNIIYVSNFEEGSISIIDLNERKVDKLIIGGMPRGIIYNNNKIYIADNYKNKLIIINSSNRVIEKTITLGREPNAMVYYNLLN